MENVALGDKDELGSLVVQQNSFENHIASATESESSQIPVKIRRADTVAETVGRIPNVVKVDVEGFEEEVLKGMQETLRSPALRAVLIEVHFLKLERRGHAMAPVRIEKMLGAGGFRTTWVDSSHVFATR